LKKRIAKPRRAYTEDELCELIFVTDWRSVRNSFQNNGVYRQMITTLKQSCEVDIIDSVCIIDTGGFKIAIEQERFEEMYIIE
jgi:hypothetical protein